MALLKKCSTDANVVFCVSDNYFGFTQVEIKFVRYCVRDNAIYLYEYEPAAFAKEEQERDIEIYEIAPRTDKFVKTSYREN
jgi:hypothetical protein